MGKEEIEKGTDEVILKCLTDGWIKPHEIRHFVFEYLTSQNVAIKLEGGKKTIRLGAGYYASEEDLDKEGYTKWEPLI